MECWHSHLLGLIRRASCDLPTDVEAALEEARGQEEEGGTARKTLDAVLANVELARRNRRPICQDTGTLLFRIQAPPAFERGAFERQVRETVREAVEEGTLRRNCVDTLTGENNGLGIGRGNPVFLWEEWSRESLRVSLLQKGGGCENVGRQYALPERDIEAGRDLEGVRRCVLDAVFRAQGNGCAPGVVAVVAGGDRATAANRAKHQFFRRIGDRHENPRMAELERRLLQEANALGVGPMGLGGRSTVLDVFAEVLDRLPASYFVTVSVMCWAFRRASVALELPRAPETHVDPTRSDANSCGGGE